MQVFPMHRVAEDWRPIVTKALQQVDSHYLSQLTRAATWLPGIDSVLNAFTLPLKQTRYLLFGESPYPRANSANGYAFWDAQVTELWSEQGLSKAVNRATSLRNLLKMLLVASGRLSANDTRQPAIAALDKSNLLQTLNELFKKLLQHGFLLLNTSLVLQSQPVKIDAKAWQPFMETILASLQAANFPVTLILFGKVAHTVNQLPISQSFPQIIAEHPYNLSFITNPSVLDFFRPFDLLKRNSELSA